MTHPALERSGLYVLTDGPRPDLIEAVAAALAGGAAMLQYRDATDDAPRRQREAAALVELGARHRVPVLVENDVELARHVGAAGVHLSRSDADVRMARRVLGDNALIGVSCRDDMALAIASAAAGADYVSFGVFFDSPTRPEARRAPVDLLREAARLGVTRVAIGGITPDNGRSLVDAGADYLAVVSGVFAAPDIRAAAQRYALLFTPARTPSPP